jgi:hypothetical protein
LGRYAGRDHCGRRRDRPHARQGGRVMGRKLIPRYVDVEVAAADKLPQRDSTRPPTKPKSAAARQVAESAANIYKELTGKEATVRARDGIAYGPFLEFLSKVFRVCKIRASAESQARLLRKATMEKSGKIKG